MRNKQNVNVSFNVEMASRVWWNLVGSEVNRDAAKRLMAEWQHANPDDVFRIAEYRSIRPASVTRHGNRVIK